MYFSKLILDIKTNSKDYNVILNQGKYGFHKLIWKTLDYNNPEERNFLFREELNSTKPTFFVLSENPPKPNNTIWNWKTKHYQPVINNNEHFRFLLRANPVVTKIDDNGKHHRHDVIMNAKWMNKKQSMQTPEEPFKIIEKAASQWLNKKSVNNGFLLQNEHLIVDAYQQHTFYKKKHRIKISTIDYEGILDVTDVNLFKNALYHGLGPAKGFGCGLILIKRIK